MKTKVLLLIGTVLFNTVSFASDPTMKVKISNDNETRVVDIVDLGDGTKALRTSGLVQIEELFGQDPQGSAWTYIGTAEDANGLGSAGDIVNTTIAAASPPLDLIYPGVTVSTAVTAGHLADPNPERAFALDHCADLNADANFIAAKWKCSVMKDFSGVFVNSKLFNEFGTRTASASFSTVATGSTVVTTPFETVTRRGLSTELARSPNNPRQGILAISGSVTTLPGAISNFFIESLMNGAVEEMAINPGGTPDVYSFTGQNDGFVRNVQKVTCGMNDNNIKFGQFLGINSTLTNGIEFMITSQGQTFTLPLIKSTDDWKHVFTLGVMANFKLEVQAGRDDVGVTAEFDPPIVLENNASELIQATINDNLSSVISLICRVVGFKTEV